MAPAAPRAGSGDSPAPPDRMAPEAVARLGVAVVSWNVRELLRRCLATIARTSVPVRVVVVDNASADGSAALVAEEFPDVTLIANPGNAGFTRANNQAFAALGVFDAGPGAPPYVLALNPDTEILGDGLERLVGYLDAHPAAGAVGPALFFPDGSAQSSRRRFPSVLTGLLESTPLAWHWPDNAVIRRYHMADVPAVEGAVDWLTGAAVAFRTEALRAVGGFDEGYFMYSEELDLCRRLRDAGWEVHFVPSARVVHHEAQSSAQVVPARHLHFQRSRVLYFRKHHGPVASGVVRAGILVAYAGELALEAAKWLVGHRRALRRARVAAYWGVLRDGLAPRLPG